MIQFSNDSRTEYDLAPIDEEALRKATREMVRCKVGGGAQQVLNCPAPPP